MNKGPNKKLKSNSSEPVAGSHQSWPIPKLVIAMADRLPADVFLNKIIKELSFKDLSMFYVHLKHHVNLKRELLSEGDVTLLLKLKRKLLSATAKDTWKNILIELNKMDCTVPVNPPAEDVHNAWWYFSTVIGASHAIYRRQNEEIAYLKKMHPNHEQWANIDTQELSAEEATLVRLMARHQQLDALNASIIRQRIDVRSNRLNLTSVGITRLPEALFTDESLAVYWKNLVELNCWGNRLQHLPDTIGNLGALKRLECGFNQLKQLPATIGNLRALQKFDFSNNMLQRLPEALGNLVALRTLYCGHNKLQQLPEALGNLVMLQYLDCVSNQLQQLPETLGNLVALQELHCDSNQLQQLPETLGDLVALRELYCCSNQLQHLPGALGKLVSLEVLSCTRNQLRQLPETLGNLVALQYLDCSDNQLQELPETLGKLALEWIDCYGNLFSFIPKILRDKFGEDWCKEMLEAQKPPTPQPAMLPLYEIAGAQPQQGEKRTERPAETTHAEKKPNNNTDALKRHKP